MLMPKMIIRFKYHDLKSFFKLCKYVFFVFITSFLVSPGVVQAWQISTQSGVQDSARAHTHRIEAINSGVNSGHPPVTLPNPPSAIAVMPEIVSPKGIPEGMAVEVNEGEYLTSKGLYKKLDNGAYLTPEGLVIQTENGALIHLPSGLPPANQ